MISVTQPRKPADDFLSALQANLQGNRRPRRRAQAHSVAAVPRQEKTGPPIKDKAVTRAPVSSNKANVSKTKPSRPGKNNATGLKRQQDAPAQQEVPTSTTAPQPTSSQPPAPQPIATANNNAPLNPASYAQDNQNPYNYQNTVPAVNQMAAPSGATWQGGVPAQQHAAPAAQPLRQSQNNFYFKNKSNIFDTGYTPAPRGAGGNRSAAQQNPVHAQHNTAHMQQNMAHVQPNTQSVVDNAIRIASQQPMPPPPSFHSPRYQAAPVYQAPAVEIIHHQPVSAALASSASATGKPLNSHYTQSFNIGGGGGDNDKTAKELERRRWIQELENQIREKKEREKQEKNESWNHQSPRQYQQQTPAFQHAYPPQQEPPHYPPQQPTHTLQAQPQTLQQPQHLQQPGFNPQNLHPSPSFHPQQGRPASQTPVQGGYMLGQNSGVDPLEMERRQDARKRALENQEMIRQQVEERERLKKEAISRRKREEVQEMRKIEEDKMMMAREAEEERQKARKKEAAQLEQIQEMRMKIEEANKTAADLKRSKRHRVQAEDRPDRQEYTTATTPSVEVINRQQRVQHSATPVRMEAAHHSVTPSRMTAEIVDSNRSMHNMATAPVQMVQYASQQVRYLSNAATQTVHEASCQTMAREDSFLPAESKLIKLQDRELSTVQQKRSSHKRSNVVTKPQRGPSTNRPPPNKQSKPAKPTIKYGKNGRRIKPRMEEEGPTANTKAAVQTSAAECCTSPRSTPGAIIAQESVTVEEYRSIADIFDDPQPRVAHQTQSHYSLPNDQVQMRYTSPQNEERSIPSAISVRQNDILSQLEKLRLGLRDRRRNVSSQENQQ